jgi:ketosteroid isomerase-like protein
MENKMTRTRSLLAGVALALVLATPAFAQDAAAPSRHSSPPPDEEQTPTPAPTAKPTPASTPAPERAAATASPAPERAEPSDTPARPAAAAKTTATPAPTHNRRTIDEPAVRAIERRPAGAPRPANNERRQPAPVVLPGSRPTFDLSESGGGFIGATIRGLENRWQRAIVAHDFATVDELVADDFVGTSSTGRVGSKSTLLNEARRDKNTYKSAAAHGIVVRSHGPRIAVATGVSREAGTTPDGRRFTNARRFTDTWMQRDGRWQCVASSATELPNR